MGSIGVRSYLFAVLGVSTTLPVLWFGSRQASHFDQEVRRRHDEALIAYSESSAVQVAQFVEARKRDLESLAATVRVLAYRDGQLDAVPTRQLKALLEAHIAATRYYAGTYIGDAEGNALVRASASSPDVETPDDNSERSNYRDRDYYQELIATGTTSVSRVQTGKWLNKPRVQIAAPIYDVEHRLWGYTEGSIRLDTIEAAVSLHRHNSSVQRLVLVDPTGNVVVDSARKASAMSEVSALELFHVNTNDTAARTGVDLDGTLMRGAGAAIHPLPGWSVVALQPQAAIDSLAARARHGVWWAAALAALFALALSGVLSTWFAKRLGRLEKTLRAVGRGAFDVRNQSSSWEPRELQQLQAQVEAMSSRLAEHRQSLEDLVSERTSELAEVNSRLQVLVNALERAEDGIEITGPNFEYLYVNPALEHITGYSCRELVGQSSKLLRSGQYADPFYEAIEAQLRTGQVYRGSFTARRKDGELFEQQVTVWPILDHNGEIAHFVGLRKDVTEQRRTEQALMLSERMASLGTVAAGVAHEINNPLTYMMLSLRMIQKQLDRHSLDLPVKYARRTEAAIESAVEGAERVSAIVKDLRVFSRADEETVEAVDPRAVLDSALRLVGNDIRYRARLTRDYQPAPSVTCNHAKLHQIFLNLFINAAHAVDQAGGASDGLNNPAEIRVCTRTDASGGAIIEISDTGVGIAPEHLNRIFDPFFTTKPVGIGTGLGLAMCRNLVRAMGGEISVTSKLGMGTTFRIDLPKARSVTLPPVASQTQRRQRVPRANILVIDDDRAVAESIREALEEHHTVTVVESAEAALSRLRDSSCRSQPPFDVLLCDIMMPGMTGLELYQHLQHDGSGEEARVVFITGGALTESTRTFLNSTQAMWLEKPVTEEQLQRAIARRLRDLRPLARSDGPRVNPVALASKV